MKKLTIILILFMVPFLLSSATDFKDTLFQTTQYHFVLCKIGDFHSSYLCLNKLNNSKFEAVEVNPLLKPFAKQPILTAGIHLAHAYLHLKLMKKLKKKSPVLAIITGIVLNGVYSYIVYSNYRNYYRYR